MEIPGLCFLPIVLSCFCFLLETVTPVWLTTMEDVYSIAGHPLLIDCKLGDYKGEKVSWTRLGSEQKATEFKEQLINGTGDPILRLTIDESDSNTDSGMYSCAVEGGMDERVVYAEIFTVKARGGNVSEGVDANLECKLTPEPEESEASIIWKKDGIPLDQIPSLKDRISFDPANATLTINAAKLPDSGVYTCVINLSANTLQTFEEQVILQGRPFMVDTGPKFSATEKSLTLKCPVKATPKPEVFWQRGDEVLEASAKYKMMDVEGMASASLEISDPQKEDFGEYVCTADNGMGKLDIEFQVVNATMARMTSDSSGSPLEEGDRNTGRALWGSSAHSSALVTLITALSIVLQSL